MSGARPSYALQKIIERAIKAAKDAGLEVGGVDVLPDGTVRIHYYDRKTGERLAPENALKRMGNGA